MTSNKNKTMSLFFRIFLCFGVCLITESVLADCSTPPPNNPIFNNGVQTNSINGKIGFTCGSDIINASSTQLVTTCVGPNTSGCTPVSCTPKSLTCTTVDCSKNTLTTQAGTMAATFPTFSGGSTVTNPATVAAGTYNSISVGTTTTFSGGSDYQISTLTMSKNAILNMAPGNYYVKTWTMAGATGDLRTINVSGTGDGSGTVRIFLNNGSTATQWGTSLNMNFGTGSAANKMIIFAYNGITFTGDLMDIKAYVYSPGNVILLPGGGKQVNITGAITASNINLGGATKTDQGNVTWDSNLPTLAGFGPISCTSGGSANHFGISMASSVPTCTPTTVTISALRPDNSVDASYTGTIALSTQGLCSVGSACSGACTLGGNTCKGTWNTTGGCTNCGGTNGYAEYTFQASDNGVRNFTLTYPPEGTTPTNIIAYDKSNSGNNGTASSISFTPSQFIVVESTATVGAPPAPAGYSTPQVAGTVFNPAVKIVAYSPCGAGIASNYTGNKTIRFYSTYVNPTSANAAGASVIVNGTAIANSSAATPTTQTIAFVNGVATLSSVKYSDVGSLTLTVSDNANSSMTGISGNIVVKPYNFAISGTGIPGTSNPTGAIFGKAGQPFSATVTVMASDGTVAGSFGKETTPQGILLQSASLAAPSGGKNGSDNLGTIGNGTAFTNTAPGVFTGTTFTFDEVGSINLLGRMNGGNYLGAGDVVGSTVLVGRFQPDHFNVTGNTPQFATGCGGGAFTYLDQPFVYATAPVITVTAMAANNPVSSSYITTNYNGSFKKIAPAQFPASSQVYLPGNAGTPSIDTTVASLPLPTETNNGSGTMTYTFAASGGGAGQGLRINRPSASSTPSSPFAANIKLQLTVADSDTTPVTYTSNPFVFSGVSNAGIAFNSGANFYHGRLFVPNAFGSEIAALSVPMQTQYYNGSIFVTNAADNCTTISSTAYILLTDPPAPQVPINTTASLPQPTFVNGTSSIVLSAPNASGQKNIEVNVSASGANLPWLQSNWPFLPGAYGDPHAQANFGTYKGSPSVIYRQENYP